MQFRGRILNPEGSKQGKMIIDRVQTAHWLAEIGVNASALLRLIVRPVRCDSLSRSREVGERGRAIVARKINDDTAAPKHHGEKNRHVSPVPPDNQKAVHIRNGWCELTTFIRDCKSDPRFGKLLAQDVDCRRG